MNGSREAKAIGGFERRNMLRSAGLEHPWSGYHLVDKAIAGRFASCSFKLGAVELERYMRLAEDNITVTASVGRVEALRAKLKATLGAAR